MSGIWAKLQRKDHHPLLVLDAPEAFAAALDEIAAVAEVERAPRAGVRYPLVLIFVVTSADLLRHIPIVAEHVGEDALLWVAYPKKTSKKYASDLSRDEGWLPVAELGYRPVRQIAIDEDWSAVRYREKRLVKGGKG